MKSNAISIRLDPDLRESAEDVLHDIGMTMSEAVTVFFKQVVYHGGLPFPVRRPRLPAHTVAALDEMNAIREGAIDVKGYESADELFEELGIKC
ncbi:MAG: type II toxin-antitoxin system RelB/DinJ family antitoxin [Oscillospiraceae bacterium]|jgi:DNA-damage-inducible protein J|nr:type II toxin-antitoxin system RelB/DinJ family antitoxin [Oscillospiraceae bacterium]